MIALFQHGAGEPPGYLLDLLRERALHYTIIPIFETGEVSRDIGATHLVFLGGQMSVNDDKEYPWLLQEKQCIREAVRSGTPVLGICLGAQLIASAFGKKVFRCEEEKGWCRIRETMSPGFATPGNPLTVFQWHGENFELPDGSQLVYRGDRVEHQMFTMGTTTGVQFHPEVTEEIIRDWMGSAGKTELDMMITQTSCYIRDSHRLCRSIFNGFVNGRT